MLRTEVVIRNYKGGVGVTLTEVQDVAELERLLAHLRQTGIHDDESGETYYEFETQYVLSEDCAYFEVIIGEN